MKRKHLVIVGLFVFAVLWVFLMGLTGSVGGSAAPAEDWNVNEDGRLSADITNLDKQEFRITLSMNVKDNGGKIVEGLSQDDFHVSENGKRITPDKFIPAGKAPVRAYLVIDTSLSMRGGGGKKQRNQPTRLKGAQDGALAFLKQMRDGVDHVGIIFFDAGAREVFPIAKLNPKNRKEAEKIIRTIKLRLRTDMFDGIQMALDGLKKIPGKRAIIVLTDGKDTQRNVRDKMMKKIYKDSKQESIPLYCVTLGANAGKEIMADLAHYTRGKYVHAPSPDKLEAIYRGIGESLQSEYTIIYESPNPIEDGRSRRVNVMVRRGNSGAKARSSYNVPGVLATGTGPATESGEHSGGSPFLVVFLPLAGLLAGLFVAPFVIGRRRRMAAT